MELCGRPSEVKIMTLLIKHARVITQIQKDLKENILTLTSGVIAAVTDCRVGRGSLAAVGSPHYGIHCATI